VSGILYTKRGSLVSHHLYSWDSREDLRIVPNSGVLIDAQLHFVYHSMFKVELTPKTFEEFCKIFNEESHPRRQEFLDLINERQNYPNKPAEDGRELLRYLLDYLKKLKWCLTLTSPTAFIHVHVLKRRGRIFRILLDSKNSTFFFIVLSDVFGAFLKKN